MDKINVDEKFGRFTEHWRPKVIGTLNGQEVLLLEAAETVNTGEVAHPTLTAGPLEQL